MCIPHQLNIASDYAITQYRTNASDIAHLVRIVCSGLNFWKLVGGAQREKDAQGTIKNLLDTDFISDLAHFFHNIVSAQLNIVSAQLNIGSAQALPNRYKVTPMFQNENFVLVGFSFTFYCAWLCMS